MTYRWLGTIMITLSLVTAVTPAWPQDAGGPQPSKPLADAKLYTDLDRPQQARKRAAPFISAPALAAIGAQIVRQIQPCADRQVKPGPGAERIRVTIMLRLNRDGSLAAEPQIRARDGVDDQNSRYVAAVDANAIATFKNCSPLRGLPPEYYDVPSGWSTFVLRYKLPG